jgi:four helix bundle protein
MNCWFSVIYRYSIRTNFMIFERMTPQILKDRTRKLAISVLKQLEKIPNKGPYFSINDQLSRASMSVGANYRAASRAKSSADFINKLKIVEEECDEVMYFIEVLQELLPEDQNDLQMIHKEANELLAITVASIKTVRKNNPRN